VLETLGGGGSETAGATSCAGGDAGAAGVDLGAGGAAGRVIGPPDAAARARFSGLDRRRSRRSRQQDRRIEQHGVLFDVAAARPGGLDEQRHERLGNRLSRSDLDDAATVAARDDAKLEPAEKRRPIEALTREHIGVGQPDLETLQLVARRRELDLGMERLIQGGLDLELSKPKRPCSGGSGQQWRNAPTCP
jgi:hypothetical protein